jgi:hypothetical protein
MTTQTPSDINLGNIPQWQPGIKISPNLDSVPGFNPLMDFINDIKTTISSTGTAVVTANNQKKAAINKAKDFLDKYNQGKDAVTNTIIDTVANYAMDFSSLGAKFIIANPFYGGLPKAREEVVRTLSSSFKSAPLYSESTWVSSITFIANIGDDLINGIKLLMFLVNLLNGKNQASMDTVSDMIYNPLLSPIINLITEDVPLFNNSKYNDVVGPFGDPIKDAISTGASLLNFSQDSETIIKDLWDNSVFKNIENDITTDPTNTNTALGSILNTVKNNAGKPLDLSSAGIANPFNSLVSRLNTASIDFKTHPYETWFNLATLGDLFPGIGDVAAFAVKAAGEISSISDFGSNGLTNGLNFVDTVTDFGTGVVSDLTTHSASLLDGLKTDLNLLDFDLFLVPPVQGGLEQLRYIYSEWFKNNIPNAPQYNPNSLTLMINVVFGVPTNTNLGLTNLAKIFNINLV